MFIVQFMGDTVAAKRVPTENRDEIFVNLKFALVSHFSFFFMYLKRLKDWFIRYRYREKQPIDFVSNVL